MAYAVKFIPTEENSTGVEHFLSKVFCLKENAEGYARYIKEGNRFWTFDVVEVSDNDVIWLTGEMRR